MEELTTNQGKKGVPVRRNNRCKGQKRGPEPLSRPSCTKPFRAILRKLLGFWRIRPELGHG